MSTQETHYRPGLLFKSRYSGLNVIIRQPTYHVYADGSREETSPIIVADFADWSVSGSERLADVTDPEGGPVTAQFKAGGVFDLDSQADRLGWDDEAKEMCARKLLKIAEKANQFGLELVDFSPPSIQEPFPNYDGIHHKTLVSLVEATRTWEQAIAWERAHKNRDGVIAEFEQSWEQARQTDEPMVAA